MAEYTKVHVGVQNDQLYLISGKPPALDNDYPVHDADRTVIAKIYHNGDFKAAAKQANVFAAAPDLLEALEEVMEWVSNWYPDFIEDDEWQYGTLPKTRAAIRKAKGEGLNNG